MFTEAEKLYEQLLIKYWSIIDLPDWYLHIELIVADMTKLVNKKNENKMHQLQTIYYQNRINK